jgi:orotate phosphoribosyltransferase
MVSIFTYGFEEAIRSFEQEKVKLKSLTNYSVLLDQAMHDNYITEKDKESLNEWRIDPANWGKSANERTSASPQPEASATN